MLLHIIIIIISSVHTSPSNQYQKTIIRILLKEIQKFSFILTIKNQMGFERIEYRIHWRLAIKWIFVGL